MPAKVGGAQKLLEFWQDEVADTQELILRMGSAEGLTLGSLRLV